VEYLCLENQKQLEQISELSNLVKQVFHDLKSPMLALEYFLKRNEKLPAEDKLFIRSSIKRILNICNDLNINPLNPSPDYRRKIQIVDIEALFNELSTHKSIEKHDYPKVKLKIYTQELIKSNFYKLGLNEADLFRILSNLINNSFEAISGEGQVVVNAYRVQNNLVFSVVDNGCGFESRVLEKLGLEAVSHGKDPNTNMGIGLLNAFKKIESVGGKIRLPFVKSGATVEVHLPIYGSIFKRREFI
jgi:signal transduction histidine kinase